MTATKHNQQTVAPATVTGAVTAGGLPRLPVDPVSTPYFDTGRYAATMAYRMRSIVTFNGPSGTGKTTTAVTAVRDFPMRFIYVKLRHRAGTKEVAIAINEALHPSQPTRGRVREADYIDSCIDALCAGTTGIIADEVHYVGVPGLIMLAQLWESVQNLTGVGFPMLLVGSDVNAAAGAAPELATRLTGCVNFAPLEDDELIDIVRSIDDRCAATDPKLLRKVNKVYGRGLLRYWSTFFRVMNLDPTLAGTPITPDEIRGFLAMQSTSLGRAS